ncbi:hypothetical protein [Xenorhabdus lircayensis]|uniref:Phage protein n=1 Tax=Xenorhabdus lircayensis TaxID=2763499 RepID=A0ABS0UA03_9GAMM|nr:hypothetical protein [Xenorhabdus lircayensis]MBI6550698.1 hypothetical protein [Xenorhabdus lircayensis]
MYPATISYSYVEVKSTVRQGRTHITYMDLGDMHIDMSFSEFAKRSNPDHSEILAYLMATCDEERLIEEFQKIPNGNRYLAILTRQAHKEAA